MTVSVKGLTCVGASEGALLGMSVGASVGDYTHTVYTQISTTSIDIYAGCD